MDIPDNFTSEDEAILDMNSNFTVSTEVSGPAIAAALSIEIFLGVITNFYILIYTLGHYKILKQPSTIFLTSLTVANLILVLIFMPFSLTSAAAGGWIFGETLSQRNSVCQFVGFTFAYSIGLLITHLAIISVDRFLFIVKPVIYKRCIKPWTATIVVAGVWIILAAMASTPFYGFGRYGFSSSVGTCVPIWVGEVGFVIYFTVIAMFLFTAITVASVWTFCFTRKFIRKQRDYQGNHAPEADHIYSIRILNLIGIFGVLLVAYIICFSPYVMAILIGLAVGLRNVPRPVFTTVLIFLLLLTSANPVVQIYFRRDMKMFLFKVCMKKSMNSSKSKSQSEDRVHATTAASRASAASKQSDN